MKTLYAMFLAAMGVPAPDTQCTSRLVPREPPTWHPLPNVDASETPSFVTEVDTGACVDDVISGSIVFDVDKAGA